MKQWMLKWFENVSMQCEMQGRVRIKESLLELYPDQIFL